MSDEPRDYWEGRAREHNREVDRLRAELAACREKSDRLEAAIREHRDQKGDDRCWIDDVRLYAALDMVQPGDAVLPPKCEFLESCERFWEQRQSPDEKVVSEASRMTIGQLERELAACRAAREAAPRPDREALGRVVREAYRSAFADIVGKPPLLPPWDREDGRDGTREIERRVADAVAAAVAPPVPAAIVNCGNGHFDAFESIEDARVFVRGPLPLWVEQVCDWTWHPAGTPGAAIMPPAPAAIVQVRAAEFDAFVRIEDAEAWMASRGLTPWRTWIERVRRWTWHGPAAQEGNADG